MGGCSDVGTAEMCRMSVFMVIQIVVRGQVATGEKL